MKNKEYREEAFRRWGSTDAYKESEHRTAGFSKDKWNEIGAGMERLLGEFAKCMNRGELADSHGVQSLCENLQGYITEHMYQCTDEIFAGLGKMYVCDERFKKNIDKHSAGTAEFVSRAIEIYCSNKQ